MQTMKARIFSLFVFLAFLSSWNVVAQTADTLDVQELLNRLYQPWKPNMDHMEWIQYSPAVLNIASKGRVMLDPLRYFFDTCTDKKVNYQALAAINCIGAKSVSKTKELSYDSVARNYLLSLLTYKEWREPVARYLTHDPHLSDVLILLL